MDYADHVRAGGDATSLVADADIKSSECLLRELLTRVTLLEQQLTGCLVSQPRLNQVVSKCSKLELELQIFKRDVDQRFDEVRSELTNLYHQTGSVDVRPHLEPVHDEEEPEWRPEHEGSGPDLWLNLIDYDHDPVDVKPYKCKLCPGSRKEVFDGAEGLAEHYTSQHPVSISISDSEHRLISPPRRPSTRTTASVLIPPSSLINDEGLEGPDENDEGADTGVSSGDHACPECARTFCSQANLRRHIVSVHFDPGFTCEFCEKPFHRKDKLKQHQLRLHGTISEALKRVKKKKPEVKVSEARAERIGDHACPDCSRTFLTQANLRRHMISIHSAPSLSCEFCGKPFHRKDKLKQHQLRLHGKISESLRKKVDKLTALGLEPEPDPADVQADSVPLSLRRVLCPECGRSVARRHLPGHLRNHTAEKSHVCEICGVAYKDVRELTIHMRRHTGERPFACTHPGCEKRFTSWGTLRNHLCIHTGKPYVCDECGRTFVKCCMLKIHKRKHAAGAVPERVRRRNLGEEGVKVKRKRVRKPKMSEENPAMESAVHSTPGCSHTLQT